MKADCMYEQELPRKKRGTEGASEGQRAVAFEATATKRHTTGQVQLIGRNVASHANAAKSSCSANGRVSSRALGTG